MFVNAILHQQVPVFCEKETKIHPKGASLIPPKNIRRHPPRNRLRPAAEIGGYKISAYERTTPAGRYPREFPSEFPIEQPSFGQPSSKEDRRDVFHQAC
jgi:hypothetical protein